VPLVDGAVVSDVSVDGTDQPACGCSNSGMVLNYNGKLIQRVFLL
jgi:hypothetical protein